MNNLDLKRVIYHNNELHPDEAYILEEEVHAITAHEARQRAKNTAEWMRQIALKNLMNDCYRAIAQAVDMRALTSFEINVDWKYESLAELAAIELEKLGYRAFVKKNEQDTVIEVDINFSDNGDEM